MNALTMIIHVKELFGAANGTKRYETSKELFCCKIKNGSSVNTHVIKMIIYIEKLN
jgi:hypothetical protein